MLLRMKAGLAGPAYVLRAGDEREFPDAEAIRLIDAGYAVPVGEKKIERAVVPPAPEKRKGKRD